MSDPETPEFAADANAIKKLLQVMAMLRDAKHGCPWDLEQTIQSLIPYTIEEVYEVVDAIERKNMVDLEDELGDLLFQVVFYSQLTRETDTFSFADVAETVTEKLIRRHPHVFSTGAIESFGESVNLSPDQVVTNWEKIKGQEREIKRAKQQAADSDVEQSESLSILDEVPRALPALERARKLQKKAARAGFDWTEIAPVVAKLREELDELEQALSEGDSDRAASELGDVFFSAVNLARHQKTEPETVLRQANLKFEDRFRWIEARLSAESRSLESCSLEELDTLWAESKTQGL
ncbi:MAG: nucleoside triphosphate pyrophosphohydrolase [Pseudomonadota bacterium]|nr:nucleoside triphosphate pyrophosphohydrolase [Pseudomonadota bacterium]